MGTKAFAPAKVNLSLHVTGRRADGYHLLDSFVVFADLGDWVEVAPANKLSLHVDGAEAASVPGEEGNSALRAASLTGASACVRLTKEIPVAAGLGGGSSDAAATLRALARSGAREPTEAETVSLGADVPVCLRGRSARMTGIGEVLKPVPPLPPTWLVLVNPRVALATADVFRALEGGDGAPMPDRWPAWTDAAALAGWLSELRNDLEPPARCIAPVVEEVLSALRAGEECLLARMSGSGATCFGLYRDAACAGEAAARLAGDRPDWWVRPAQLLSDAPVVRGGQVTRATT